jgi:hypothetical protein
MRKDQVLFTYLHLAASRPCTDALLASGTTSIAYETVQTANPDGSVALPLLAPMSEVAGRLSAHVGAYHLMRTMGGRGVLMGGVPGVAPAVVVVIGGGMAGDNAAAVAWGMGAHVTVFDLNVNALRKIDAEYGGAIETRYSARLELENAVKQADLVIGAVLVPGAKAPKLVTNDTVAQMKPGSVLVDIAIDQGGCFEDSRPTTHDDPTFKVHVDQDTGQTILSGMGELHLEVLVDRMVREFGVAANVSITKLFLAGIVPGLLMGVAIGLTWWWVAKRENVQPGPRMKLAEKLKATREGILALGLPVFIIGGMKFGVFTPTEAAVAAVAWARTASAPPKPSTRRCARSAGGRTKSLPGSPSNQPRRPAAIWRTWCSATP